MLSAKAPHGREISQDLRKKIISLHKKGEVSHVSQNTVAKVVQTFKKDGTATISEMSRSSMEVNTSSGASSDEKG